MDNSFFTYMDWLVLMGFFSGYPLIYLVFQSIGNNNRINGISKINICTLLPYAYALVGILYLGLLLKNLYPVYTSKNIMSAMQEPFLKIWGLLSILFLIPALNKKPVYSLLHSLVFFLLLVWDILQNYFNSAEKSKIRNDMNVYTNSLIINLAVVVFIILFYFLLTIFKKVKNT